MNDAVHAESSSTRRTRARLGILALITFATMLNYLDRTILGVAAPALTRDLGIDAALMGIVFSAFSWTYAAAQIPGGMFLDRFGVRLTYGLALISWSTLTLLQGLSAGLLSLLGFRLGLGVAEAPCFPANSRILVTWFPQGERARANGVYSIGMYFGIAFLSPLLFWIAAHWGWRALFVLVGAAGVAFGLVWFALYRDPHEHRRANAEELRYIETGGGLAVRAASTPIRWRDITSLLRHREILGPSIGQFAANSTLVFFLTWFPTYLATERHMSWVKVGVYAMLPFIAASIGVLSGGVLSDALVRHTKSVTLGRKIPIVTGLLLCSLIVVAAFVKSDALVIAIMSIAFFGQGMSNLGWTLISEVAPSQRVGLTAGVFNLCTNLAGIVTPLVIGFVVAATGSFYGGLAFIGAVAIVGALSYAFVLGSVTRVSDIRN